ncbi:hypothetical protein F511_13927 [Dorcoceras hygrometricum]|uniref:Phosphoglycerate kinase n=1 Tax=Dorcoceras hygrometricum TaxID=472368 RepID=A0A2Z7B321_9LAMI|nr:hypothetical protein F511_13927 [Dorcoceras hygrometricum]
MSQLLGITCGTLLSNISNQKVIDFNSIKIQQHEASFRLRYRILRRNRKWREVLFPFPVSCKLVDHDAHLLGAEDESSDGAKIIHFPHVQTLRNIPKVEILEKIVMVILDSIILLNENEDQSPTANALYTIKYLYEAGARVIMVGSWSETTNCSLPSGSYLSTEFVADYLASVLELKVVPVKFSDRHKHPGIEESKNYDILLLENLFYLKGELANCSKFAKELATGVDIVVNDAFSQSHKVLASTVGIASFCPAYVAGFYFEEGLSKLKKLIWTGESPYMAIIGGGNLADKAAALQILTSTCDGLVFVGSLAFQIMHVLGVPVPMEFVELGALKDAIIIVESAKSRNIPLVFPRDVWCVNNHNPEQLEIFSVTSITKGWQPVDIGPRSLQDMVYLLSKCKRILWIGPLKFNSLYQGSGGTFKLAEELDTLKMSSCSITFVGNMQFKELLSKSKSFSEDNFVKNAAVVWEFLKGRKLPGLEALDRAYPFHVDWDIAYCDPMRPLVVDIGSGNGLFLFGMARRITDMNFLGLEIKAKLVDRCLNEIHRLGIQNVHFITANATSTLRSIVSSYPGALVLVSIQCPNPDFNKPDNRWRMLQRSLVEAIADRLVIGGKVFLQSDIEAVALRMKKEFIEHGKGKLALLNNDEAKTDGGQWLKENPFEVPSDWERHVLDRGDPMYRLLLVKVTS